MKIVIKYHISLLILLVCTFLCAGISFSSPTPSYFAEWDVKAQFNKTEGAIGNRIGDYMLINQDGKRFYLNELLDKPIIVSFIYTTCDYACPMITTHLRDVVKEAGGDFGRKFRIITISFNPDDTPERIRNFGGNFTSDFENWKFAVGNKDTISRLANDVGLSYIKSGNGYQHINFFTIVDTKRKVYKQVYGIDFKPKAALKYIDMAIERKRLWSHFASIFDTIKAFCYTYDAKTGQYAVNLAMLIPVFLGIIAQGTLVLFLAYLFRTAKRLDRKQIKNGANTACSD